MPESTKNKKRDGFSTSSNHAPLEYSSNKRDDVFSERGVAPLDRPVLMLAPMEGLTGEIFRKQIISIGSVDTVATEFIRLTSIHQRIKSLTRPDIPLQIQFMASNTEVLTGCIENLYLREELSSSDWIDLNVGCPSRRVNSRGAGAALLKTPKKLLDFIGGVRKTHSGPLSIKTRLGFESVRELDELLRVLGEAPLDFITIHARTRCGGYTEPIHYDALRQAVETLPYPVIGNGEIWSAKDARKMLQKTKVRGLMCGRGVVSNPFLFQELKLDLTGKEVVSPSRKDLLAEVDSLFRAYQEAERKPNSAIGVIKETSCWLGRNPLLGRSFFEKIKRMQSIDAVLTWIDELRSEHLPANRTCAKLGQAA